MVEHKRSPQHSDLLRRAAADEEAAALRSDLIHWAIEGAGREDLRAILLDVMRQALRQAVQEAIAAQRPLLEKEVAEAVKKAMRDALAAKNRELIEELREDIRQRWKVLAPQLLRETLEKPTPPVPRFEKDTVSHSRTYSVPWSWDWVATRDWVAIGTILSVIVALAFVARVFLLTSGETPTPPMTSVAPTPLADSGPVQADTSPPQKNETLRTKWESLMAGVPVPGAETGSSKSWAGHYACWFESTNGEEWLARLLRQDLPAKDLAGRLSSDAPVCTRQYHLIDRQEKFKPQAVVLAAQVVVKRALESDNRRGACVEGRGVQHSQFSPDGVTGPATWRFLNAFLGCQREDRVSISAGSTVPEYLWVSYLALRSARGGL